MHIGLDDDSATSHATKFYQSRHSEGLEIIASGNVIDARNFLRRGCPPSLRAVIWSTLKYHYFNLSRRLALCLPPTLSRKEKLTYMRLHQLTQEIDLLTDELFVMDVSTFCDDTSYFVFEVVIAVFLLTQFPQDKLRIVSLCFSRDEWVLKNAQYLVHKPLFGLMSNSGHRSLTPNIASPPCGIQPFLGFCAYLCPLCYLYNDSAALYSLARSFYCRLWCRLNVISGDENCLLRICSTFESLLLQSDLRLYLHLLKINLHPLHVYFSLFPILYYRLHYPGCSLDLLDSWKLIKF